MIKDFDKYFAGILESENGFKKTSQNEKNPFDDIFDDGKSEKPKVGKKDSFDDLITVLQ